MSLAFVPPHQRGKAPVNQATIQKVSAHSKVLVSLKFKGEI